ncbi:MAG: hypothetical protein QXD03_02370 [Candidatus Anstonellales archaeon]
MSIRGLFRLVYPSNTIYVIISMAIFFLVGSSIIKTSPTSKDPSNVIDYKSISYVKIDYGGGILYNIYTGNTPVIIKKLRSYEGDILVLYLNKGSSFEVKRTDCRIDNGRYNP